MRSQVHGEGREKADEERNMFEIKKRTKHSGREARFLFAIHREGFEEAPVVRSGSRSSAPEEIQARGRTCSSTAKLGGSASETAAAPPPPPHANGEVEQLRAEIAKLRMEEEDSKSLGMTTEVDRLRAELQEVQNERDCLRDGQQVTPMELTTASSRMAALMDP